MRQQQFKLPSTKAPSISNSINSSNNIDSILKRPVHLREASTYSVNDNDHRNLVLPNSTERFTASPSNNIGNENIPQYQKTSSVAHSINEGYNDDTFSYNEVEDNLIDEDSTDDGDLTKIPLLITTIHQPRRANSNHNHNHSRNHSSHNYILCLL